MGVRRLADGKEKKVVSFPRGAGETAAEYNRRTYGAVIRESRLRRGLSQPQLAALLDTSKNYVCNWEKGRARPDMNMLPALCRALGITLARFFGQEETGPDPAWTEEQKKVAARYALLSGRDRRLVGRMIDAMLEASDDELRARCLADFAEIFHNDSMAAAGTLNMLGDGPSGEYVFVRRTPASERADEIITVTGDSMEPTFRAGDDLLVEHAEALEIGEIGIFVINGEGFVKELRRGGVYSHNAAKYPFRKFLPDDDVRCVGRVLGRVEPDMRPTPGEMRVLEEMRAEYPHQ